MAANKNQPSQAEEGDDQPPPQYSAEEVGSERSKSADKAIELEKKAKKYTDAAAAAGNAQERQALLNKAINAQIEAESFGKWAKFLNSGAFQGFVRGSIPGVTIGALTGTLVGGLVSLVTGGLGAGIGFFTGPIINIGDVAGNMIGSLTSKFLPDWEATEEQKKTLENMMGAVHEQEPPTAEELQMMAESEDPVHSGQGKNTQLGGGWGKQSYTEYATSWVPSFGSKKGAGGKSGGGPPPQAQSGKKRGQQQDRSEAVKAMSKEDQARELALDKNARNLKARMAMMQNEADTERDAATSRANESGQGPPKKRNTGTQQPNGNASPSQPRKTASSKTTNGSAQPVPKQAASSKGPSQSQGASKPATPSKQSADSSSTTASRPKPETGSKQPPRQASTRSASQPKAKSSDAAKAPPQATPKSGAKQAAEPEPPSSASKPQQASPTARTRNTQKKPQKLQVRSRQAAAGGK